MRMRIECLPHEIESALTALKKGFRVSEVSKPYKNRNSELVRTYVTVSVYNPSEEKEIQEEFTS